MIDTSNSSKNCASFSKDENYFHRVVKETFLSCWREEKEWTVGNLTKLWFERNDEKKKQEIIYERIWILGGLWRVIAYEYSSFIFLFFSFFYRNSQWKCSSVFLENAVKYYGFLGPNIDRRENTLIASSRISTSFLIIFSVIFFNVIINTSIWEAKTKFVHLLRNTFSSNTHYIFKNKLRKHITNISKHHLPEWQINSTIYANVAF